MPADRTGSRGGGQVQSVEQAQSLFDLHRPDEAQLLREYVLVWAHRNGEWHADMGAHLQLAEPNMLGSTVNALARGQLLRKANRHGEVEHRKSASAASHGRASYVWALTATGKAEAWEIVRRYRTTHGQEPDWLLRPGTGWSA